MYRFLVQESERLIKTIIKRIFLQFFINIIRKYQILFLFLLKILTLFSQISAKNVNLNHFTKLCISYFIRLFFLLSNNTSLI